MIPPVVSGGVSILEYAGGNGSTGLIACPSNVTGTQPGSAWQIFSAVPSVNFSPDCLGFDLAALPHEGGPNAFEYF